MINLKKNWFKVTTFLLKRHVLMNRILTLIICLITCSFSSKAQQVKVDSSGSFTKDTILILPGNAKNGYEHSFIVYIPEGTLKNERIPLLVEPNNSGFTNDSIEVHLESALYLASKSSVGNNVSRMLKIPLLVPVFPRPSSYDLIYTHALDRDVMMEENKNLKRLDLQLINMAMEAKQQLKSLGVETEDRIFMSGFSASGTFVNRFSFLHPEIIKALAIGGLNSKLMLPVKELEGNELDYPLGINDFNKISGKSFNANSYREISQFIYMGELDENDAVKNNDAYSEKEREIIYSVIGEDMQSRWKNSQDLYKNSQINVRFKTYEGVGHWTTSEMLWEIIRFFQAEMSEVKQ